MPAMLKSTSGRPAVPSDYADNPAPNRFFGLDGTGQFAWLTGGGGFPLPAISQQVFVAKWGNDATGDGSQAKPYLTIGKAYATILDATSAKIYAINVLQGTYTENVALKPFVALVGIDKNLVDVAGTFTLHATFVDPFVGQVAWCAGITLDGPTTFNYVVIGSSLGSVILHDCIVADDVALTQVSGNQTIISETKLSFNYTQTGGDGVWFNVNGDGAASLIHLVGSGVTNLTCSGGSWAGNVTADQNAQVDLVTLTALGFNLSSGVVTIVDTAAHTPVINAARCATPDNCAIGVAGAGALSPNMTISHRFANCFQNPTAIGATGTTTVDFVVPAALLGITSLEAMHCAFTGTGAWQTFLNVKNCSVTYSVTGQTIHVNIYNPGVGFNITDLCNLLISAYLPKVL